MSNVIDIDLGYDRIVRTMYRELDGVTLKVGVQGSDTAVRRGKGGAIRNTNQPLAVVAAVHEFGLNKMPQRSFLRAAYDENKATINKMIDNVADGVVTGMSAGTAINQLGNVIQGMVQRKIVNGPFKPNAPSTIKRKGSARPLIDTGRLRQSIRYVIQKGDGDNE